MNNYSLISVSDKTDIIELAKKIKSLNYKIISTGGTAKLLHESGNFNVDGDKGDLIYVSEITKFPEILNGRVKTLHPNLYGGILARRELNSHQEEIKNHNINNIDLVIVNLYPFANVIKEQNVDMNRVIENIDIGGVSLMRAAAKNYNDVIVICDPSDYDILMNINNLEEITIDIRRRLAIKAYRLTSEYDRLIYSYLDNN
jgi:phosphoribosylaminoimidazolecarboxamide formyltransferase/IMP cyclohydrolase